MSVGRSRLAETNYPVYGEITGPVVMIGFGSIGRGTVPLIERQGQARSALANTRATELWVAERAVEHARLRRAAGADAGGGTAPVGMSGLEAALRAAGLRDAVTELANTAEGGITLRFDAVRFSRLAAWLSDQSGQWGYDLDGFTFERGAREDVVAADLRLVPAAR